MFTKFQMFSRMLENILTGDSAFEAYLGVKQATGSILITETHSDSVLITPIFFSIYNNLR